jgi:hypothetical protein
LDILLIFQQKDHGFIRCISCEKNLHAARSKFLKIQKFIFLLINPRFFSTSMFTDDAYDATQRRRRRRHRPRNYQCFFDKAILVKKSRRSGAPNAGDRRWFKAFMHKK